MNFRSRLSILYACILVVMIGFGLTLPILPYFIERMTLEDGISAAYVSTHVGLLTGIFAFVQFFMAPLWGKLSDRLGRKPLLLLGLAGYALSMLFFGTGTSLVFLYVARTAGGIFAAAILPIATAYVADTTLPQHRGRGMAWLGSAISLGVVFGPAMGSFFCGIGALDERTFGPFQIGDFSAAFFITAFLALLAFFAALAWLPESVKARSAAMIHPDKTGGVASPDRTRVWGMVPAWLIPFLMLAFISQFTLAAFEGTFALHAQQLLDYDAAQMGVVFVVCGLVMALAQGLVVSRLIDRIGGNILLPAGFALAAVGLMLLMFTQNALFVLVNVSVFALGIALITPCLATGVSVGAEKQAGKMLGLLNAAASLGQAAGPVFGGFLFIYQVHLPYFLLVLILFLCVIYLVIIFPKPSRRSANSPTRPH